MVPQCSPQRRSFSSSLVDQGPDAEQSFILEVNMLKANSSIFINIYQYDCIIVQ